MEPLSARRRPVGRAVWDPPWFVWAGLWLLGVALIDKLLPSRLEGHWLLLTPLVIAVAIVALRQLWRLPPAISLCAAIVFTIFSSSWAQFGLERLPLNRLLALFVLLQFLLRAPGTADVPRPQVRNVHLLMAFTVVYVIGSAAVAGTLGHRESIFTLSDVLGAMPYLLFFVAPAVFASVAARRALLATLVGLGAYLGLMAVFESLGPHALVIPHYIVIVDASEGVKGVGGPFQSRVAEGFATFACAVAATIALGEWRDRRARYLAAAVAGLCVFACFSTLERGIWIAALAATVITALCSRQGRRWLVPGLVVCALGIAVLLTLSSALASKTSERAGYQLSVQNRENQTAAGLRMVAAKPLFGFGWDRYASDSLEYFRQPATAPLNGYVPVVTIGLPQEVIPLHDTYLAYATEIGLIGVLLWLASLLTAVAEGLSAGDRSLRPWKLGLLAITIFFLIASLFNPHEQPFPLMLLLIWAGVARGYAPAPRRRVAPAHREPSLRRLALAGS